MTFFPVQTMGNRFYLHEGPLADPSRHARRLCGSGPRKSADGLLVLTPSKKADVKMQIVNADGSAAAICGNGLCCVARHLAERGLWQGDTLTVETGAGVRQLRLFYSGKSLTRVQAAMGQAKVYPPQTVTALGQLWEGSFVNMGNPHFVIEVPDLSAVPLERLGPAISGQFPGGCNVEVIQKTGEGQLLLRVWERGVGVTAACGSGICAAAAVARGGKRTISASWLSCNARLRNCHGDFESGRGAPPEGRAPKRTISASRFLCGARLRNCHGFLSLGAGTARRGLSVEVLKSLCPRRGCGNLPRAGAPDAVVFARVAEG